jgi:LysR family transcriptional regulator, glycine cleavage system transcriptional activator
VHLPPLNALRAFETAARHESFARAAEELHVTQGAVSRYVKLLEEHLGATLFRRLPQGVELTTQGRALLPELTGSFERIARAARRVAESDRELRVGCQPTLAGRWLVRRLSGFQDLEPGIRVTLGLMCDYEDFFRGGFDLGIVTYDLDVDRPGRLEAVLLRREALAPVCAPALLGGADALREPADLARHTLLHPHADRMDWRKWLRAAGVPEKIGEGGQVFETLEMVIAAALGGLGVGMTDLHLAQDELSSGALVAPFDLVVSEETGYFLSAKRGRFEEPNVAAFRDWLLAEAAADPVPWPRAKRG